MVSMRERLRRAKAKATDVRPSAPALLLFALPRGGSTLVADAIACNPGVFMVNEPFITHQGRRGHKERSAMAPDMPHSQVFSPSPSQLDRFEGYMRAMMAGQLKSVGTVSRPRFPLKSDLVAMKILNASWMAPWCADHLDARLLVLLRHPGSNAASLVRLGWAPALPAYLERPEAMETVFRPDEVDYLARTARRADPWTLAILDWVVRATPLIRMRGRAAAFCRYEDVTLNPEGFVDDILMGIFGLEDRGRMLACLSAPSNSSMHSQQDTKELISAGERDGLVNGWRRKATAEELRTGQAILDRFGIDLFSFMDDVTAAAPKAV